MRSTAALLMILCLAACATSTTSTEQLLVGQDELRQRQAVLDADAIMRGMEQARQRAEALARTSR
jgi:hypothetical protein